MVELTRIVHSLERQLEAQGRDTKMVKSLLLSYLQSVNKQQKNKSMKLLKTVLENIRESMLDLVGANEFSLSPVVPFGGF